ncbi:DNA primase [Ectothiorhodospira mobilis]|uniref:DNA primase n=1 Tax=Ectothiorhodospira mobilis TaxID=195064 RepID=UPI00190615B3|nr:DNA primase [Ectothiorhodospira mobilis]MBK1691987.1 DNA primase [Ectothiorhodospira mobilis]
MSRIPRAFIDELIARTDLVELVGARVPLKKQGREYTACCPFHAEKTPSFYVSPQKQFYHCFGCGAHGTAIDFLMQHDNLDFVEAVEELARQAGMEVPREAGDRREADTHAPLIAANEAAAARFEAHLRRHARAVDYLKARGVSPEVARDYRLGYAVDTRDDLLRALTPDHGEATLAAAGLTTRREGGRPYDRFRGRLMFPIRDGRGRVVGFGGRLLGDGTPKYLNTPETPVFHKGHLLYGLFEARRARTRLETLLVVEGYMDVIALAQFGLRNAVATLGTATTRDHLERLFRVVPRVVFCFDGDRAGGEAAWRAVEQALPVLRDGREVRFLFLPQGDDPDSLVRREGPEGFQARVRDAKPLSDTLLDGLAQRHDTSSREGRATLGQTAAALLRPMPPGLLRSQLAADVAHAAGVSPERFEQQLEPDTPHAKPPPSATPPRRPPRRPGNLQRLTLTPVRLALSLLLNRPDLAARVADTAWLRELQTPGADLLAQMLETLHAHPHLTPAALVERWRDSEAAPHLLKLAQWQPPPAEEATPEQLLEDALGRLRHRHARQRADALLKAAGERPLTEEEKRMLQELLSRPAP